MQVGVLQIVIRADTYVDLLLVRGALFLQMNMLIGVLVEFTSRLEGAGAATGKILHGRTYMAIFLLDSLDLQRIMEGEKQRRG